MMDAIAVIVFLLFFASFPILFIKYVGWLDKLEKNKRQDKE